MNIPIWYGRNVSKRDDILDATLELLSEKGIHGTPMSLIAAKAGVGMGTIYNYFKSKGELINALYVRLKQDESEYMLKEYKKGLPVRQVFILFWTNIFKYFISKSSEFQFINQFCLSPIINQETRDQGIMFFAELINLYDEGQKQEIFKDGDLSQQIFFTFGALSNLAQHHIAGDIVMDDVAIERAVTLAWDAIKR
jgi:AcrR family transcriptional regulator